MIKASEIDAPFRLDGRVALITGGTRGTGRAIAEDFAGAGARVILTGRDAEVAKATAKTIGDGTVGLGYDAARPDACFQLAEDIRALGEGLDILVNNAAMLKPHIVQKVFPDEFDESFQVNVRSMFFLTRALHPLLKESGKGVVVCLGAAGAHRPMQGIGVYCATKAAVANFSRTLAAEWADDNIRVNILTPGSIATDFILPKDPAQRKDFVTAMASRNAMNRLAAPLEIARGVRFLASDAASFMTGSDLVIDGGFLG